MIDIERVKLMRRAEEILGGRIEWRSSQQCYAWYSAAPRSLLSRSGSRIPYLRFQRLFHGDDGLLDYLVTQAMDRGA